MPVLKKLMNLPYQSEKVVKRLMDLPWDAGVALEPFTGIYITDEVIEQVAITNGDVCD